MSLVGQVMWLLWHKKLTKVVVVKDDGKGNLVVK